SVLAMTTAAGQAKNVTSDAGVRNRVEAMNATAKASNTASPIWAPPTLGFGPIMYTSNTARNPRRRRSIRGRQCGNSSWTERTTPIAQLGGGVERHRIAPCAGLHEHGHRHAMRRHIRERARELRDELLVGGGSAVQPRVGDGGEPGRGPSVHVRPRHHSTPTH